MSDKKTSLYIDTSKNETVYVTLEVDSVSHKKRSESRKEKAQALLALIDDLLKEQALTIGDITTIQVNTGPGSFTGLRVGVAVANVLGFLLGIPVNRQKFPVEPRYS